MDKKEIIQKTIDFVKDTLVEAEGGHDWFHIERVYKLSKKIAETEEVDMFVVELGALLHDIADFKFHNGDEKASSRKSREFLSSLNVNEDVIIHVEKIADNISFKGEKHVQDFRSLELDVVQDADRLDGIGAMGIARNFNYGGYNNDGIYDPEVKPKINMNRKEYVKNRPTTINHFYEKSLLLKDLMNTKKGRSLAEHRHKFMEQYLDEFFKEWNGEL